MATTINIKGLISVEVDSTSGNQTATVKVLQANTGRNIRTVDFKVTNDEYEIPVQVKIAGKLAFIDVQNAINETDKTAKKITISGESNSSYIKLSRNAIDSTWAKITRFEAAGVSAILPEGGSHTAFVNLESTDPGASGKYPWSADIEVEVNESLYSRDAHFMASGTDVASIPIVITQDLDHSYLSVEGSPVSIGSEEGATSSFNVISNTSWTIN